MMAAGSGWQFNRKIIDLSFSSKNGLRVHFDSVSCLNYQILNIFLVERIAIQIQINCRAATQANVFLLDWVPGVGAAPGSDDAHGVSPTAVHVDGANMAREVDRVRGDA